MRYRPHEFAKLVGVSVKTLHRWEKLGKLSPHRTKGNHRLYTDEHIDQLAAHGAYTPTNSGEYTSAMNCPHCQKKIFMSLR